MWKKAPSKTNTRILTSCSHAAVGVLLKALLEANIDTLPLVLSDRAPEMGGKYAISPNFAKHPFGIFDVK